MNGLLQQATGARSHCKLSEEQWVTKITELSPLGVKGVKRLYPQTPFPHQCSVGMSGYGPNMVLSVLFIISTKPYNSMEYWPYYTD